MSGALYRDNLFAVPLDAWLGRLAFFAYALLVGLGPILGALALVGLPELLREFAEFRYLFYGAVLVIMMLTRPEGLFPEARRRMELEEFREEEKTEEEIVPA